VRRDAVPPSPRRREGTTLGLSTRLMITRFWVRRGGSARHYVVWGATSKGRRKVGSAEQRAGLSGLAFFQFGQYQAAALLKGLEDAHAFVGYGFENRFRLLDQLLF
jgi:hypothetical protein